MNKKIIVSILIISIILLIYNLYKTNYYFFNKLGNLNNNKQKKQLKQNNNLTIYIYDREKNKIVKEFIPLYIKIAIKQMFKLQNRQNKINKLIKLNKLNNLYKKISVLQGRKFNKTNSIKYIPKYIKLYNININEIEKNINEYKTFNEFFSRGLKLESRPIYQISNPNISICCADSRLMVFDNIDDAKKLWIKGNEFSIKKLLNNDENLYSNYENGSLCIFRLAPQDYHRWHLPTEGVLLNHKLIDGSLYSVNPLFVNNLNVLTENKRIIAELQSIKFGKIIIIAIGTIFIGSIKILLENGHFYEKGQVHGYFEFGGSTIILLFQPNKIKFNNDLIYNSNNLIETLVKAGMSLGNSLD